MKPLETPGLPAVPPQESPDPQASSPRGSNLGDREKDLAMLKTATLDQRQQDEAQALAILQQMGGEGNHEQMQTVEYSPEELEKLMSSENFLEALRIAAAHTADEGYESGFKVILDKDKRTLIPQVVLGGVGSINSMSMESPDGVPDPLSDSEQLILLGDASAYQVMREKQEPHGVVLNFHFHPNAEGAIVPSGPDLENYQGELPGMAGVGQIDDKGNIRILLLKPTPRINQNRIATYDEYVTQNGLQKTVNHLLDE